MSRPIRRREFLAQSAGAALALGGSRTAAAAPSGTRGEREMRNEGPKKAVLFSMLPGSLSVEDRFKLARDVGFAGVEAPVMDGAAECERMRRAAETVGVRIHSVIYGGWDPPLSHPDPTARQRSLKNAAAALQSAGRLGAENILLVPAVVDAATRYQDAYRRSREGIERLVPVAEKLKVQICVENVWNNFLLSPLEFAQYIDRFKSPWVQAYFDVGNVVIFGWPEDWIRTLGPRIRKVHLKDFKGGPGLFGGSKGSFVNLRDGSINWPEVRRAFAEIGYAGFMTTELGGGDEAYLRDVSARVDRILAGT
jgi:L-ribulose-5-phosphate 3-epimerase